MIVNKVLPYFVAIFLSLVLFLVGYLFILNFHKFQKRPKNLPMHGNFNDENGILVLDLGIL